MQTIDINELKKILSSHNSFDKLNNQVILPIDQKDIKFFLIRTPYFNHIKSVIHNSSKIRNLDKQVEDINAQLRQSYNNKASFNDVQIATNFQKIYKLRSLKQSLEFHLQQLANQSMYENVYQIANIGLISNLKIDMSNAIQHDDSTNKVSILMAAHAVLNSSSQLISAEHLAHQAGINSPNSFQASPSHVSPIQPMNYNQMQSQVDNSFHIVAYKNEPSHLPDFHLNLFGRPLLMEFNYSDLKNF